MGFTKQGGMKLKAFNLLHDTDVNTSLPFANYSAVESVLEKAKLAVRSCTERTFVPEDQIVQGTGTSEQYKEGQIFMKRDTKGNACLKCLVPIDPTKVTALKNSLATKKFGGETPVNTTVSYSAL